MAFMNEKTEDGKWQTIDRERNISLVYKGRMGGDEPYDFDLYYADKAIKISAFRHIKEKSPSENDVIWNIVRLFIPGELEGKRKEIKFIINEAFDACGFLFSREHVASVVVSFKTPELGR